VRNVFESGSQIVPTTEWSLLGGLGVGAPAGFKGRVCRWSEGEVSLKLKAFC